MSSAKTTPFRVETSREYRAAFYKCRVHTDSSSSSDSQIQKQIQVLNQDFARTGISYQLVYTDRTINPAWFDIHGTDGAAQTQMKQALRKGGAADLNIYSVG